MKKDEFGELFVRALNAAADMAEATHHKPVPRSFLIELHALGYDGRIVSVDEALGQIYLGTDRFHKVIDVGSKN